MRRTGIRVSDPRLKNMIRLLNNLKAPGLTSIEDLKLDANSFKSVLNENMVLITKALQNQVRTRDSEAEINLSPQTSSHNWQAINLNQLKTFLVFFLLLTRFIALNQLLGLLCIVDLGEVAS